MNVNKDNRQIGNYFITNERLGSGAFGEVFLGFDVNNCIYTKKNRKRVAIKTMQIQKIKNENLMASVDFEARVQYSVISPNIVKLFQVVDDAKTKTLYHILEYCADGNLNEYRLSKQLHKLTELESVIFLRQILIGYEELHKRKIIHRDIKPQNILLSDNVVKITDFGFARKIDRLNEPAYYSRKGTQEYMSPQILNNEMFTYKCDIWSLGILLYELLYGQLPWTGNNESQQYDNIRNQSLIFPMRPVRSSKMKELLKAMLQIDEKNRISWEDLKAHEIITRDIVPIQQKMQQLAKLKEGQSVQGSVSINKFFIDDNQILGYLDTSVHNSETLEQDQLNDCVIDDTYQLVTEHNKEKQRKQKFNAFFQEKRFARNVAFFFNYVVQKLYYAQTYNEITLPNQFFDKLIFYLTKQQLLHLRNIHQSLKSISLQDQEELERFQRTPQLKRLQEVIRIEVEQIKDVFKMIQTNLQQSKELPKNQAEFTSFCQEFAEILQEAMKQLKMPNCSKEVKVLIQYLNICQAPLKYFKSQDFDFHQFYEDIENLGIEAIQSRVK